LPRKPDQKLWEWRRDNPVRPIVFDAPDHLTEDVVHLHLEHRIAQRLLNIFTSQGFVYDDLSRACLAYSKDAIPRVALIGRLALYGANAARLHEEIVAVTARWQEPDRRGTGLKPYGRESEEKTIELIEEALLPSSAKAVPSPVQKQLINTAHQDVKELLPHLEQRAEDLKAAALKKLGERAGKESVEMQRILEDQRKRILDRAKKVDADKQLRIGFDDVERRQLDLDRKAWDKRLTRIETELQTEPARVREVYEVTASRLEPVGLVYLWPVTG
jgi:vacuolar-type H+-ATPase subunit H